MTRPDPAVYLSFFMFTADLRPADAAYSEGLIGHARAMLECGFTGFDLPIAPVQTTDHATEIRHYRELKRRFDAAGLGGVRFTTNVGATRSFDPTSPYAEQRAHALAYLKSRVEISAILGDGDSIMAGPFLFPYGVFPTTDGGDPLWSDTLQDWLAGRYPHAHPLFDELSEFAEARGVKLAIEPVDHWETPAPNMVRDVLDFCRGVASPQTGATFDTAHIVLGSSGPAQFRADVADAHAQRRLHYVHISPPDRGALGDSWIPWDAILPELLAVYAGPYLVEVFNALSPFVNLMRLSRRKFWIPGQDAPVAGVPSAYDVACEGIATLRAQIARVAGRPISPKGADDGQ